MTAWRPQTPPAPPKAAPTSPLPHGHSINRLRRLAAALARVAGTSGCPSELAGDAAWFAAAVQAYEEGAAAGLTWDQASALRPASNAPHWPTLERRARRDELLRQYVETAYGTLSRNAAAEKVRTDVQRIERARGPLNGADAVLAEALRTGERMPRSTRGIREALEVCTPLQSSNGNEENRRD